MITIKYGSGKTPEKASAPMIAAMNDLGPAMESIGEMMVSRAHDIFEQGGPDWAPLAESTIARKRKAGKTKPLIWNGILKNSATYLAGPRTTYLGAAGPYARIQYLGGKAGRGKKVTLKGRPYFDESEDALAEAQEIIDDYILGQSSPGAN